MLHKFTNATLFLSGLICAQASSDLPRPNILLIISEDHGPELGCYGDPYAVTPVLDRMAAQGVRYENAYVAQPGCSPSRASIMTGLYTHQNGQVGLATWGFRMRPDVSPTLPAVLREAGYRTGNIGKIHVNPESAFPYDMRQIPSGNFARRNLADYARFAGEFMTASDAPFFLCVNYPDAHVPWERQVDGLPKRPLNAEDMQLPSYFGVYTRELHESFANHYNSVMRLDSLIGDLLAQLELSGKAENTLVVFVSDHGPDSLRGKRSCYEGGVRVPLIVRWPAKLAPDQTVQTLVSTVDLLPTFRRAAGLEPDGSLPGSSLFPECLVAAADPRRDYVFFEYNTHAAAPNYGPQRALRGQRYKLIKNLRPGVPNPGYTFTLGKVPSLPAGLARAPAHVQATYARMALPPAYELYDLEQDPDEFYNLADDPAYAAIKHELQAVLQSRRESTSDPLLSPAVLERFTNEVMGVTSQAEARQRDWNYVRYFYEANGN
jgi:N-sulfoglucosamine sulfohydrolase